MDIVREIMVFYYQKGGRDYSGVSARWNRGAACRGKNRQNLILGHFYIALNLEMGRTQSHSLSNGLKARGRI
jgi:hypothetical protein